MIVREKNLPAEYMRCLPDSSWQNAIFYDIETTGLGWRSSHLYLIGALYFDSGIWKLKQWFLDRPFEEKELLLDFSSFLETHTKGFLADYNGDTFDRPYLCRKYSFYGLSVPYLLKQDEENRHVDLFRVLRPLKPVLPVDTLRLQDVEALLHTDRKDTCSGKDLIEIYHQYLQTLDISLLDRLFLHNHDDILGIPRVTALLSYDLFRRGEFSVTDRKDLHDHITFELTPSVPFPVRFTRTISVRDTVYSLSFLDDRAVLELPVREGERKQFFPDPQKYYYLPEEDRAVHKSVGTFINADYRVQAKASTCYQRIHGRFIPLFSDPSALGIPCLRMTYSDKLNWARVQDLLSCDMTVLRSCLLPVLSELFRNHKDPE